MKIISILIPTYNEEAVLKQCYHRIINVINKLHNYRFEILFVNDGSEDHTLTLIKSLRIRDSRISYVDLSRNFGKEIAMAAGLDHAKGDAVILMDADLQDPPELIPKLIKYWEQGYDDVYAIRNSRKGETWLKKFTASQFYRILQKTTRIPIQEDTGDFRLLDRRAVDALRELRETQRYTKGMFSWIGFNKKGILFERAPRAAGKSKWHFLNLINLAIEGITSFTVAPLRFSSIVGVFVSVCAFIYMSFIIGRTLIFGNSVNGYASLMTVILFLGGLQLLSIGIIGEYLGRIFNETKRRPLYFVNEYNDEKVRRETIQINETFK